MAASAPLKFYGATWCLDCQDAKRWLGEHNVAYDWIDIEKSAEGAAEVKRLNDGKNLIPTLVFADGSHLAEPTADQLAAKLGVQTAPMTDYSDLAIIGAGPTGMAAAIYTTREGFKTTLFEKGPVGGQASITDLIDNYPGFPDGVGGLKLSEDFEKQARRFGANFQLGSEVKGIATGGKYKKLTAADGEHLAKSVLIATGTDYRKLNVPGEKELTSKGVHYCATCDGPFYKDKELIVIGGGNSAMQESVFLTKFASKLTILVRGEELKGSQILIDKIKSMPKIEIHSGFTATEISKDASGRMTVEGTSAKTGNLASYEADGIFVFIGLIPNTQWLKGIVELDEAGFIKTDKTFQTNLPGVYAAGDVRSGSTLQIASAVGEGVTAALMIREYLKEEG